MVLCGSMVAVVSMALGPACSTPGVPISVDGMLSDWAGVATLASDPSGDASGAFDLTSISATSAGTILRLRLDLSNASVNLQDGNAGDGTLRIEIARGGSSLTVDMRDRSAYLNGNTGNTIHWTNFAWNQAPTFASSAYEVSLDLGPTVGASVGDTISINFSGSDSLSSSASFALTAPAVPDPVGQLGRPANTGMRLASLNTLNTGITNGSRGPRLGRVIAGVDADVYCFCEEYNSNAGQIASEMAGFFSNGSSWNVAKEGDNAIVSEHPVTQVSTGTSSYAAALVELPAGPVFVLCVHLKCCGFVGDSSDNQRVSQAQGVAQLIADFRAGTVSGGALAAYASAPVMVTGDWNLVGSRTPLDILEDDVPGPGLVAPAVRHLVGSETYTWLSSTSSFWPGRLDLMAYSMEGFRRLQAYALDTAELDAGQLAQLGALASDSAASDHLMLVADFALTCKSDADGDGVVNLDDIQNVLFSFGQETDPFACADLDGNGFVDLVDLQAVLFDFGQLCASW